MRELSDHVIVHQADAFENYVARGGSAARWLLSKDYGPEDLAAFIAELRNRRGDEVVMALERLGA